MKKELELDLAKGLRDYLLDDDITWLFLDSLELEFTFKSSGIICKSVTKKELIKNFERMERNLRLIQSALRTMENRFICNGQSKYESLSAKIAKSARARAKSSKDKGKAQNRFKRV